MGLAELGGQLAGRGTDPGPVFNHRHGGKAAGAGAKGESLSSKQLPGLGRALATARASPHSPGDGLPSAGWLCPALSCFPRPDLLQG